MRDEWRKLRSEIAELQGDREPCVINEEAQYAETVCI